MNQALCMQLLCIQVVVLSLQRVHVLPQTVLYIADAETFSGHEESHSHGQKKGKYKTFCPVMCGEVQAQGGKAT